MKKLSLTLLLVALLFACTSEDDPEITSKINGHEYVDLGLPSGIKWATCNIGASSPFDYGNYYAWGETKPKTTYTEANCQTYNKNLDNISNNAKYDVAYANWGGSWRLPSKKEWEELCLECAWTWTTQGEYYGYKVTGANGNSIFLPAAGYRIGASLLNVGGHGLYWSSTLYKNDASSACNLFFNSSSRNVDSNSRFCGQSVRPVSE
ncbi:MAG: fibrobacter succinogenes major paralogous domain-containing protein [Bacteroidaceae bacterium]|nr:fibrobacter succinogenes major paralogous domain-containing protein [Bacteroidaceae bacterium]